MKKEIFPRSTENARGDKFISELQERQQLTKPHPVLSRFSSPITRDEFKHSESMNSRGDEEEKVKPVLNNHRPSYRNGDAFEDKLYRQKPVPPPVEAKKYPQKNIEYYDDEEEDTSFLNKLHKSKYGSKMAPENRMLPHGENLTDKQKYRECLAEKRISQIKYQDKTHEKQERYHDEIIEKPTKYREEPTKYREEPTKYRDEPTKYREEPTKYREEPTKNRDDPTRYREEPSKYRDESSKYRDESTRYRDEPTKYREEQTNYREDSIERKPYHRPDEIDKKDYRREKSLDRKKFSRPIDTVEDETDRPVRSSHHHPQHENYHNNPYKQSSSQPYHESIQKMMKSPVMRYKSVDDTHYGYDEEENWTRQQSEQRKRYSSSDRQRESSPNINYNDEKSRNMIRKKPIDPPPFEAAPLSKASPKDRFQDAKEKFQAMEREKKMMQSKMNLTRKPSSDARRGSLESPIIPVHVYKDSKVLNEWSSDEEQPIVRPSYRPEKQIRDKYVDVERDTRESSRILPSKSLGNLVKGYRHSYAEPARNQFPRASGRVGLAAVNPF